MKKYPQLSLNRCQRRKAAQMALAYGSSAKRVCQIVGMTPAQVARLGINMAVRFNRVWWREPKLFTR